MQGRIFDIKRFAVHDGRGIRTTVFFKGCPLNCKWCHNPEGLSYDKEIGYSRQLCIACGKCVAVCHKQALFFHDDAIIRTGTCDLCGECTRICPTLALCEIGRDIEMEELLDILKTDEVFYQSSEGGVTFSGGEVFNQFKFLQTALLACKLNGYHTTIETSLMTEAEYMLLLTPLVDQWIVDIKLMDDELHKKYTGLSNQPILNNLKQLVEVTDKVLIRVPLINEITDTSENLHYIRRYLDNLDKKIPVEVINYNPLTPTKYTWLDMIYELTDVAPLPQSKVKEVADYLNK